MKAHLVVGNCLILYYADNLSIFSCVATRNGPVWKSWSIDGEKMEGQHTAKDVKNFHKMIVSMFSSDENSDFSKVAMAVMDE